MELQEKLFKGDKVIWVVYGMLLVISMLEVFSSISTLVRPSNNYWEPFVKHFIFLMAGLGTVWIVQLVPPIFLSKIPITLLPISIGLLTVTMFNGVTENGASRWLDIMGVRFQPSELAKLAVISTVALLLSQMKDDYESQKRTTIYLIVVIVLTCGLIIPENFSTAAILGVISFMMMFIGRISLKILGGLSGAGIAFLLMLYFAAPHIPEETPFLGRLNTWTSRIERFRMNITPETPIKEVLGDKNYQSSHAKFAVSTGGVFGKFLGNSVERDFLPQAYSDFIYAIIIEEMGLLGGMFVLSLYLILVFRAGVLARRCQKSFYAFLLMGLTLIIVFQALINMSVAVGLIPVTGQPLPIISRGGTSIIITSIYFGIILRISEMTIQQARNEEMLQNVSMLSSGHDLEEIPH